MGQDETEDGLQNILVMCVCHSLIHASEGGQKSSQHPLEMMLLKVGQHPVRIMQSKVHFI